MTPELNILQLARGNPYIGMLSIGHSAESIPPPPGKLDGPVAGGIAMHGRFEGQSTLVSFNSTD